MKKVLLWGMGKCFIENVNVIKYHQVTKTFSVVGVTSNISVYEEFYGYKYIKKCDINTTEYDYIVVIAEEKTYKEILTEAVSYGIARDVIFSYKVLSVPNFDIDRYMYLRKNTPSILIDNCWGGITYHRLDLEFKSPLINMFESTSDYLKLLKNLKQYMSYELELIEYNADGADGISHYPVVRCGDVTLHFNHYHTFEEAKSCWERRKQRINYDNLLVMMYTEEPEFANEFLKLPYKKKFCFVPFARDEKELIHVQFRNKGDMTNLPFWGIVNYMAWGSFPYYDVWDLLIDGKFSIINDIKFSQDN